METVITEAGLKKMLMDFQQLAEKAIQTELFRIGRPVQINELKENSVNDEINDYLEFIGLDQKGETVFDTSFSDTREKSLSSFISDNEITHWDLISLLGSLKQIKTFH